MRPNQENLIALTWALLAAAVSGFCLTGWLVAKGATSDIDRAVLRGLRTANDPSDPLGPRWLEEAAIEISALGGYPILLFVSAIVLIVLLLARQGSTALFFVFAFSGGSLLSSVLKQVFARPRPDMVDHLDRVFTSSFPSAHAMVGVVAWFTLAGIAAGFVKPGRLKMFMWLSAVVTVLLVGVSRVYLGVHWPSDILAGWLAGIGWCAVCRIAVDQLSGSSHRNSDPERPGS